MQKTCVDCHNTHPDSPKKDWKVGDVRGVVEIIQPLDKDVDRTRAGLQGAFALVGAICATLLGIAGIAIVVNRVKARRSIAQD